VKQRTIILDAVFVAGVDLAVIQRIRCVGSGLSDQVLYCVLLKSIGIVRFIRYDRD
jgi:hypothetical protein